MDADTQLYKSGRSTYLTAGRYQELASVTIARVYDPTSGHMVEKVTEERAIAGIGSDFSEPGDSGSFVFTASGRVVGVVTAGDERKGVTFMTPIEDVLRDIKSVTGAVEVRLAE